MFDLNLWDRLTVWSGTANPILPRIEEQAAVHHHRVLIAAGEPGYWAQVLARPR